VVVIVLNKQAFEGFKYLISTLGFVDHSHFIKPVLKILRFLMAKSNFEMEVLDEQSYPRKQKGGTEINRFLVQDHGHGELVIYTERYDNPTYLFLAFVGALMALIGLYVAIPFYGSGLEEYTKYWVIGVFGVVMLIYSVLKMMAGKKTFVFTNDALILYRTKRRKEVLMKDQFESVVVDKKTTNEKETYFVSLKNKESTNRELLMMIKGKEVTDIIDGEVVMKSEAEKLQRLIVEKWDVEQK
jgi:hypothetical protein